MKIIASHNGLKAAEQAFQLLAGGTTPLDACVAAATLVEDDPAELTVGYGGLPNEDGVVELDAAVMDGATLRGSGVAGLRGIRHATQVARLVMQRTSRVLLVGEGALDFAVANGFGQEDLLTEQARRMWLYWKRTRSTRDDWRPPADGESDLDVERWFEKYFYGAAGPEGSPLKKSGGTVHFAALDAQSHMACATSTSGHPFKIAGRVGDSPILGAGLYVDDEVGSCGSTGHGEANLEHVSSHAAVELMRNGRSPVDAGLEVLRRIARRAHADDCDGEGRPRFQLQLYLMAQDGTHAGVSMWPNKSLAVADHHAARLEPCTPLYG